MIGMPNPGRLQALQALYQQYPGRAPGGSGETGLASNDAQGWSDMLKEQQEYTQLQHGGEAPQIHFAGSPVDPYSVGRASGMPNYQSPLAGLKAAIPGYQSDDEFEAQYNPKNQKISSNVENS